MSFSSGHEKRRYIRFNLETKIMLKKLSTHLDQGEKETTKIQALSKNICAEGICFESADKLSRDQELSLEIYFKSQKNPVVITGFVAWCVPKNAQDFSLGYMTGVKLHTLKKNALEMLIENICDSLVDPLTKD